ncbi:unnamed protein product [Notodromas monacha]|uniref:Uncharacterized protein n=1 Tax=Notodromas monacha TaxID=399045 RepID=A0A7R9GD76_9CRUS|nr:unnamed protein product [Notodromas monacha]CAG0918398.1 unnamed protein product [Notodromas monacha]
MRAVVRPIVWVTLFCGIAAGEKEQERSAVFPVRLGAVTVLNSGNYGIALELFQNLVVMLHAPSVHNAMLYLYDFNKAAQKMYAPDEKIPIKFAMINAEAEPQFIQDELDYVGQLPAIIFYRNKTPIPFPGDGVFI